MTSEDVLKQSLIILEYVNCLNNEMPHPLTNSLTTSKWPFSAAKCNGLEPSLFLSFPVRFVLLRNHSTQCRRPHAAAKTKKIRNWVRNCGRIQVNFAAAWAHIISTRKQNNRSAGQWMVNRRSLSLWISELSYSVNQSGTLSVNQSISPSVNQQSLQSPCQSVCQSLGSLRSLNIASSSFSIYFAIMSVCLTFGS